MVSPRPSPPPPLLLPSSFPSLQADQVAYLVASQEIQTHPELIGPCAPGENATPTVISKSDFLRILLTNHRSYSTPVPC
jgi:hypothetical protein